MYENLCKKQRCYHPNGDWASLKNEYYREYIAKAKKGE